MQPKSDETRVKHLKLKQFGLKVQEAGLIWELGALLTIYGDSEEVRKKKHGKIEKMIASFSKKKGSERSSDHIPLPDEIVDLKYFYERHFDYTLIHSLFIAAFAIFENSMNMLAVTVQSFSSSKLKVKDIKGDGELDSIRKFLNLLHSVSSANSDNEYWQELTQFKAIRNAIIHNGRRLTNDKGNKNPNNIQGVRKLKQHGVNTDGHTPFQIKQISFLEDFNTTARTYYQKLNEEIMSPHNIQ